MADTLMLHFPTGERTATAHDAALLLDKLMRSSLADWVSAATAPSLESNVLADAPGQRPSTPDRRPSRSPQSWRGNRPLSSLRTGAESTPEEEALATVLESAELSYPAWLIRDQVETACCRFDSVDGRRACPRARLRDVRRATERAALALLARPSLSPDVFRALYGHFERVLPIADLRSHS
jgi:hypothetical protein